MCDHHMKACMGMLFKGHRDNHTDAFAAFLYQSEHLLQSTDHHLTYFIL